MNTSETMKRITGIFCLCLWLVAVTSATAQDRFFIETRLGPTGDYMKVVNYEELDKTIAAFLPHAENYPPVFANAQEREAITGAISTSIRALDPFVEHNPDTPGLLFRYAFLCSMGHNCDIPGSYSKANKAYALLIQQTPNAAVNQFYYGMFLVSTEPGSPAGILHLEKAVRLGAKEAEWPLALAYATNGQQREALKILYKFQRIYPKDPTIKGTIEDVISGKIAEEGKAARARAADASPAAPATE